MSIGFKMPQTEVDERVEHKLNGLCNAETGEYPLIFQQLKL